MVSKPWNPRIVAGHGRAGRAEPWNRRRRPMPGRGRQGRGSIRLDGLAAMVAVGIAVGLAVPWKFPASLGDGAAPWGPAETIDPAAVWLIDGDTFDHDGVRVRIADIDTPEVRGGCAEESELAARATERMRALLDEGPFELRPIAGRDEDPYGRKLRIVSRGGRSLGFALVAEGLAHPWVGRKLPWCG